MTPGPLQFKEHIQVTLAGRHRLIVDDPDLICAAVLMPLLLKQNEWHLLVTQRAESVEHHRGQISFPGGACEPKDADLLATALREAYEEVGIPPQATEVLGALDDLETVTGFVVTPFVGIIPYPLPYSLNQKEVAAVIEVPLSFLRDPANLRTEVREHRGKRHNVLFWDYGSYTIWGATARIIQDFLDLVP